MKFPRDLVARSPAGGAEPAAAPPPLNLQVLETYTKAQELPRNTKKYKASGTGKIPLLSRKISLNPARPATFS
jgi:hypothetical protein